MNLSIQKFLREKTSVFLCAVIAIVLVMSASISLSTDAYALSSTTGTVVAGSQISPSLPLVNQNSENIDCEEIVIAENCCDENGEQPCPNNSDCKTICTNTNTQLTIIQHLTGNLKQDISSLKTVSITALHSGVSPDINAPPPRN
jgi:hypothetical protein